MTLILDSKPKPVFLYNPRNFNPIEYLPPTLHKQANKARQFVHLLCEKQAIQNKDENKFIRLKARRLQTFLGSKYWKKIIDALVQSGAVERNSKYSVGKMCKGYRLGKEFRRKFISSTPVGGLLAKKIIKNRPRINIETVLHAYLYNNLRKLQVVGNQKDIVNENERNCTKRQINIEKLKNGELYFSECRYGRIHHNITSLYGKYRDCLQMGGKSLINLDIANSQPLFLSNILIEYFKKQIISNHTSPPYTYMIHTFSVSEPELFQKLHIEKGYNFISDETIPDVPLDVSCYIRLCENGEFYNFCQELWKDTGTKTHFKKSILTTLYKSMKKENKYDKLFKETFPNVWKVIKHYKRNSYKNLSRLMQKMESNIMIKKVCGKLMKDHPDIPCITIHDSIMTTPENVLTVRTLIKEEFAKIGLKPTIK